MGRKQLVVLVVVLVSVAVAVAVAAASRGSGNDGPRAKPPARAATNNGLGDDDANLMRRLQRKKLVRSHK